MIDCLKMKATKDITDYMIERKIKLTLETEFHASIHYDFESKNVNPEH